MKKAAKGDASVSERRNKKRKLSPFAERQQTAAPKRQRKASSGDGNAAKAKRVSFGRSSTSDEALATEARPASANGDVQPGKSILKRRRAEAPPSPPVVVAAQQAESEPSPAAVLDVDEVEKPMRPRNKVQVTRKTKEKILALPRSKRKAFLRELRAKKKPLFELALQMKVVWERLRSSKTPAGEKESCADELLALVRGKAAQLVYAHDTSRIIECLVALRRADVTTALFDELLPETLRMAKSKYAHFFVMKMLKHGTPTQRDLMMQAFRGRAVDMLRHSTAGAALECAYNEHANARQRSDIAKQFYGAKIALFDNSEVVSLGKLVEAEPSSQAQIVGNLKEVLLSLSAKQSFKHSLVHRLLFEFFTYCAPSDREEMIDSVKERVVEILHTRDGARAAMHCIWYGDAKQRKAIVKSFKGFAKNACLDEHGGLVLAAIFDSVDDTIAVKKNILKELCENIDELIKDKHGIKVVDYLIYARNPRFHNRFILELLQQVCRKKGADVRRAELWTFVASAVVRSLVDNLSTLLFDKTGAILLLSLLGQQQAAEGAAPQFSRVADADRTSCYAAICELVAADFVPFDVENRLHAVEHPSGSFALTKLLKCDGALADAGKPTLSAAVCARLSVPQLAAWTGCNRGCFILLAIFNSRVPAACASVRAAVLSVRKKLKQSSAKGAVLLFKAVTSDTVAT